jgi:DNA-binding transcriptional ArsR family regulator
VSHPNQGKKNLGNCLHSDACVRYLRALAFPERLLIIQALQAGPIDVSDLTALLGRKLGTVSYHLQVLREAGLVRDQRSGQNIVYSLHPNVFPPPRRGRTPGRLDLGCCRLVWDTP